jgi:O-antigen/teichoic acid export membrane protein
VKAPQALAKPDANALHGRVVRGSLVTLLGHLGSNSIRLGSNLILTRLLLPECFGVMALINVTLTGLHMFAALGVGPNVIAHPRGDDRAFLHTAYSVQALRGLWLTIAGCLLAWPISSFYQMPELAWMIPVASLTALIGGLTSTKIFQANRHLQLGRITLIELGTQATVAAAMMTVAYFTRSVVALLIGGLVGEVVRVCASHLALPGVRDGFAWDREARTALLTFGRWVFVSTALTFVSMRISLICCCVCARFSTRSRCFGETSSRTTTLPRKS